jgi:hypothetical protein
MSGWKKSRLTLFSTPFFLTPHGFLARDLANGVNFD